MKPQNRIKKLQKIGECGFTLIEVIIAMVLLSVALLGGASLIVGIMTGNTHSNRLTTATTLAQDKVENIKALGYAGISSSTSTTTEDYDTITSFPLFKRVTEIAPGSNIKTVTVTVYWDSDAKSVSLQTILAMEG